MSKKILLFLLCTTDDDCKENFWRNDIPYRAFESYVSLPTVSHFYSYKQNSVFLIVGSASPGFRNFTFESLNLSSHFQQTQSGSTTARTSWTKLMEIDAGLKISNLLAINGSIKCFHIENKKDK